MSKEKLAVQRVLLHYKKTVQIDSIHNRHSNLTSQAFSNIQQRNQ